MTKTNSLLLSILVPLLAAIGCADPGTAKTCLPGSVDCGNGCVQLQHDQLNCGTCGNACSAGNVCSGGTCALSCQAGLTSCTGSCRDLQTDDANCGACGTACGTGMTCSGGACVFSPIALTNQCFVGSDPVTPAAQWTVCQADATGAWLSAVNAGGGKYHPDAICRMLGYSGMGVHGGNCGTVCGFCQTTPVTTCSAHGPQTFDNGGLSCGSDALGQILCFTVMWTCVP